MPLFPLTITAACRRRFVRCLAGLVALVLALDGVALAGELDDDAVARICPLSAPSPGSDDQRLAVVAQSPRANSVVRRDYVGDRTRALLDTWTLAARPIHEVQAGDAILQEVAVTWPEHIEFGELGHLLQLDRRAAAMICASVDDAILASDAGLTELEFEFQLRGRDDPELEFCTRDEAGSDRVQGVLVAVSLVHLATGETLCTGRVDPPGELVLPVGEATPPMTEVEVTRLDYWSSDGAEQALDKEAARVVQREIEAAVIPCYQRDVCKSGQRQGALTLRAALSAGSLDSTAITVDALDSPAIASCVIERVDRLHLAGEVAPDGELGAVLIFRLRDDLGPAAGLSAGLLGAGLGAFAGAASGLVR